ncbi:NAD(P)-binding protein [Daedalea quercina L-15889]|uniref:NAD(P)-binding protein n=1 Tax=Daedalea quercina L-15889 TaxID=1314783 RepID=A0A165P4M3_9APHY|nr:NAD(P)-binding protein [Daedalea quercina L-15889]
MSQNARVVVITGCSKGGIGFALCKEFATKGCKVYATARRLEAMEGLAHPSIECLALDVTDDANVKQVVETVIEREGRIDIVVNNAGAIRPTDVHAGPLLDRSIEDVAAAFDTNTLSVLRVCKAVVPHMAARKRGLIVNVGSVVGEIPTPWSGPYAASKAAVHSLSQTLSMELRPLGLRVLSVAPGGVRSNISVNGAPRVPLPPDSLWAGYRDAILTRIMLSAGERSVSCEDFARGLVREALREGWWVGSYRFVMTAPPAAAFKVLAWLPRSLVLWVLWKVVGGKPKGH